VYFEEDFHLENPRTFDIVSERSEVVRPILKASGLEGGASNGSVPAPSTGRKALATNAILQEKLSWYMDTVEIHLISSISTASKSFFTALGSLRELHSEAADSVKKIQSIRGDLAKLDKELAMGGLKVVNLQRRRENVRRLGEAVIQLGRVVEAVSQCEEMVEGGQIEQAMDGLDDVEKLIAGKEFPGPRRLSQAEPREETPNGPAQLLDLRGIRALQGASADLDQLRWRIGKAFEGRFLNVLIEDLRDHVQSVPPDATIRRWGIALLRARGEHRRAPSALPAYLSLDNQFRMKLRHDWNGLARSNQTMGAATGFREAVLKEIKSLIRKHLPSSSDDDNESVMSASTHGGGGRMSQQEKSAILARNLRALEPEDAEIMLTKIYAGVGEAFRRLSMQVKVLLDITSGVGSPPGTAGLRSPLKSPTPQSMNSYLTPEVPVPFRPVPTVNVQEGVQQILDLSNLLGQGVDVAQTQITKILKVRSEQSHRLSLESFLRYFTLNRLFADECEAVSGRGGNALKSVVDGQIKDFVSSFGDMQRHHIVQVMDADKWDARDFGEEENKVLSRVIDGSTHDSEAWTRTTIIWTAEGAPVQSAAQTNGTANNRDQDTSAGKEKIRLAVVDEQRYILPECAMAILRSIEEFQHLMTGIPSMSQEVAACLLECLKLFNSRSSQLILGAGATRSAGLKNITTKHLALASQALSFIIAIIPYVREFVRRHSPSSSVTTDFDKVKRLYQEHQSGIHEKLVDIMSSRATTHVNALKKIDWNAVSTNSTVNPYMETLTKETSTLQKVLAKHLPEMGVQMIMDPVFVSYRGQLNKAYAEIPLTNEMGKQRYCGLFLIVRPTICLVLTTLCLG
jgi:vacuolar protein sorting-associated protein 54